LQDQSGVFVLVQNGSTMLLFLEHCRARGLALRTD
jgi:hypothetical protein